MDIQKTTATFGGFDIADLHDLHFSLIAGVYPSTFEVTLAKQDANTIMKGPNIPLDLHIKTASKNLRYRNLYALYEIPSGRDPEISTIVVRDRRWLWGGKHYGKSVNERKRTGVRRLTDPLTLEENTDTSPTFKYAEWSLNNGEPFTILDIVKDICEKIKKREEEFVGRGPSFFNDCDGFDFSKFPVENLEISDDYSEALSRILGASPELGISLDLDGNIHLYQKTNETSSEDMLKQISDVTYFGGGQMKLVDMSRMRPKEIHVLVERVAEVMFKFEERADGETYTRGKYDRYVSNVLPSPDWDITINEVKYPQGSWLELDTSLFAAWGKMPVKKLNRAVQLRDICIWNMPFNSMENSLEFVGKRDPDKDWTSRAGAIRQHWRYTYRINPEWKSRIRSIYPYRLGILDRATGTRGAAPCWSDTFRPASDKSMILDFSSGDRDGNLAIITLGYPANGELGSRSKSTGIVSVKDEDQGILTVSFNNDTLNTYTSTQPGVVGLDGDQTIAGNSPKTAISSQGGKLAFGWNCKFTSSVRPRILPNYKALMMVTCAPALPNDNSKYQRIIIKPSMVKDIIGDNGMSRQLDNCRGPIEEIYISPSIVTADVTWDNSKACIAAIEKIFGIVNGNAVQNTEDFSKDVEPFIVNMGSHSQVGSGTEASVIEVARSFAAVAWAATGDRVLGSAQTDIMPSLQIRGRINQLVYSLSGGRASQIINAPEPPVQRNPMSLLGDTTRRLIMKTAVDFRGKP